MWHVFPITDQASKKATKVAGIPHETHDLVQLLQPLGKAHPHSSCDIFHCLLEYAIRAGHVTSGLVELRITVKPGQGIFLTVGVGYFVQGCSLDPEVVPMQIQEESTL